MIGLNHALTGAAIGLAVRQPLLVIPLALASHFILDMFPHFGGHIYQWGHKHFGKIIAADGVLTFLTITTIIILAPQLALPVILGVGFAMLPDALLVPYYMGGRKPHWFHNFHLQIQWYERPPGAITEVFYLFCILPVVGILLNLF